MQFRIAGHHRTQKRPVPFPLYQPGSDGIGQGVKTETGKGVAFSFFFAQDMIMRLMLPFASVPQRGFQIDAQEFHGVQLVRVAAQSQPDQMKMIRHETISRAKEMCTHGCMEHHFPEIGMERRREPSSDTSFNCIGSENDRMALIMMSFQARQVALGFKAHAFVSRRKSQSSSFDCSRRRKEADNGEEMCPSPHAGGYGSSFPFAPALLCAKLPSCRPSV